MSLSLLYGPLQIPASAWSEFVDAHPDGTVFQSPVMFEFLDKVPLFSPVVMGAADEAGRLKGILLGVTIRELKGPSAFFSSRTVIYGGPLVDPAADDRAGITALLLQGLVDRVHNRAIFIQFRNFNSQAAVTAPFEAAGFYLRDRLNLLVDTSSMETVIKNMSASRWRQVRKGLGISPSASWNLEPGTWNPNPGTRNLELGTRNPDPGTRNLEPGTRNLEPGTTSFDGARIIFPASLSQVRDFYDILHDLYRYKVKKPLPPWEFFEQFYQFSQQGKLGVILLVECRGRIIGGILSPVTPGKTIYEWYVCGLDQEFKEVHPSVIATWAAMEYAVKHHIPQFDFMGVGIPDREYGVREFKSRFGGEMVNYGRFARINNRFFYAVAEAGYNILSLLRRI